MKKSTRTHNSNRSKHPTGHIDTPLDTYTPPWSNLPNQSSRHLQQHNIQEHRPQRDPYLGYDIQRLARRPLDNRDTEGESDTASETERVTEGGIDELFAVAAEEADACQSKKGDKDRGKDGAAAVCQIFDIT